MTTYAPGSPVILPQEELSALHGMEVKHMGPGPHPSGTPQLVHAGGGSRYERLLDHLRSLAVSRPAGRDSGIAARLAEVVTRGIPEYEGTSRSLDLTWLGEHAPIRQGGTAEETAADVRTYLRSLPTYAESEDAHEQGVSVLGDGSIFRDRIEIGRARSIPVAPSEYRDVSTAVAMHNHPRARTSLSIGDVMVAMTTGHARTEAVTREGEFVLEIDHEALGPGFEQKANRVAKALQTFTLDVYHAGDITEDQARYGSGLVLIDALKGAAPDAFTYTERGTSHRPEEVWPQAVRDEFAEAIERQKPWA